jgi:hypothetical protein
LEERQEGQEGQEEKLLFIVFIVFLFELGVRAPNGSAAAVSPNFGRENGTFDQRLWSDGSNVGE